jgi:enoyl-CoA hydratase/carnithine racemase
VSTDRADGEVLRIEDDGRVRVLTFDRPEALNAFNEALYDATTEALIVAAAAPEIAVVVVTGAGRAFSAGTDVAEMAARTADPEGFTRGRHGFPGLVDHLIDFPKPLLCAVNGMALGVGVTLLAHAEVVVMSSEARVRCPFTDLAVAPEAGSSYLFPLLMGRQQASWLLMSSEWFTAEECQSMGLASRVTTPDALLPETLELAHRLAGKPIASLVETKRTIVAAHRELIEAARYRENTAFRRLMGAPANLEAFAALAERRPPDFARVDSANPPDIEQHRAN